MMEGKQPEVTEITYESFEEILNVVEHFRDLSLDERIKYEI